MLVLDLLDLLQRRLELLHLADELNAVEILTRIINTKSTTFTKSTSRL